MAEDTRNAENVPAEVVIDGVRYAPAGTTERRMIVKGWKRDAYQGGKIAWFASDSPLPHWSSVEHERKRIGEQGLSEWQPHITEVVVIEREVSPWRTTDDFLTSQGGHTPVLPPVDSADHIDSYVPPEEPTC